MKITNTSTEGISIENFNEDVVIAAGDSVDNVPIELLEKFLPVKNKITVEGSNPSEQIYLESLPLIENLNVEDGVCDNPVFSVESGAVAAGTKVTITSSTAGANIFFTEDGTDPTEESIAYEGEIEITEAVTLKSIAIKDGYKDSEVVTAEYTISE